MSGRYQPLSNTERQAVVASLKAGVRLDGRGLLENREYSIKFGKEYGSCHVSLGETRVLAQVRIAYSNKLKVLGIYLATVRSINI